MRLRTSVAAIIVLSLARCMPFDDSSLQRAPAVSNGVEQTMAEKANELYHSPEDLVLGNPMGRVTVVEFFDYNCGYCRRALPEVAKLIRSDNDVRVVIKEYPVLGQGSVFAAKAALASAQQGKYAAFHHALNAAPTTKNEASVLQVAEKVGIDVDKLRKDMDRPIVGAVIRTNQNMAKSLSIDGTPAFVLDDGVLNGFASFNTLSEHIAAIRRNGGCKSC
jgi:protein-disulfide isomerase